MSKDMQKYLAKMEDIEENLLHFIEQNAEDDDIQSFIEYLENQKITKTKELFKSFLYLIVNISNNYHRSHDFFNKIDKILHNFKDSIHKYFQNWEIFRIFQSNKQILLYLIQNNLLTVDQCFFDSIHQKKYIDQLYIEFFYPEVESFLSESSKQKCKKEVKELNELDLNEFNNKREKGENDNKICEFIRNDQVIDFIAFLEKTNISSNLTINKSIYETNQFLLKNEEPISLIEYSAFFGSQQIFTYLFKKGVKLTSSIWPFAIHGKNPELIHFLEENNIGTFQDTYQYLIVEAIKCHHNEIADYLQLNFSQKEKIYDQFLLKKYLKHYNFKMLEKWDVNQLIEFTSSNDFFFYLCKYDYISLVKFLYSLPEININRLYQVLE